MLAEYRAYYQAHNCIRTCPYPGIPELLEQLRQRGLKLAVVSNKPDETTRTLRPGSFRGWQHWGSETVSPPSPHRRWCGAPWSSWGWTPGTPCMWATAR